jgi:hypothetical protein
LPRARLGHPVFSPNKPALATGRGEKIQPLENFPALRGKAFLLIHPGFGISTPWAYQNLARFPNALNGKRPAAKTDFHFEKLADLKTAAAGILQFARSARAGKISDSRAVPGISPRQRRAGRADVRQRLDDLCDYGKYFRR